MSSVASVGGAAGARGVGLQDRVFAWAAVAMLAEQPLPGNLLPGIVVRVGAQTGFPLDDVAAETDSGGFALFQVKAGLRLQRPGGSQLAKALEQTLEQYWNGRLPMARQVQAGLDALVVCTDRGAPATVREDLSIAVRRTASQPPGIALGFQLTAQQDDALKVLIGHVKRSWKRHKGWELSDEDLRTFLTFLHVITVDALGGEPEHASSLATLDPLVPPGQSPAAWDVLVAQGHEASESRQWRNRQDLATALVNGGIDIRAGQQDRADIDKLQKLTKSNLDRLTQAAKLPVAEGMHLPRLVSTDLAGVGVEDGNVLIVGDAGVGKTGVAVEFVHQRQSSHDVALLQESDVAEGNIGSGLGQPLDRVLAAWINTRSATLVIDGLDAVRGTNNRDRLAQLVQALAGTRWHVVATVRTFDALYGPELQRAFAGRPVSANPERVDPQLDRIRHLLVADLTDAELQPALLASPVLTDFLDTTTVEMARLLHNPFNLRLAAELLTGVAPLTLAERGRLSGTRSRLDLLDAYWGHRVNSEDMTARAHLLTRICQRMLADRKLAVVEREPTVISNDSAAVESLLSQNVLALDAQAITGGARVLVFAHNILFDYAAARYILLDPRDPSELIARLDEDPALPLVARPSLDLVIERLWNQANRDRFWNLALRVAGTSHRLASLAVAGHLLLATPGSSDLQPLLATLTGNDADTRAAAETLTSQLVGALRAPVTTQQVVSDAAPGIGWLAAQLACSASTSGRFAEAALSADLLTSLERCLPLQPNEPGAMHRAGAVAALLDACRADPQRFEDIAGAAGRHLPAAIAAGPTVVDAVTRLLDDPAAINQWGGTILRLLAKAVPALLAADPALARRTALAISTFDEQRDEQVSFGSGPLLRLHESRRQQAQHGTYELSRLFPQLSANDLLSAAQIFTDIADTGLHAPPSPDSSPGWPVTCGETQGWLQNGRPLDILDQGMAAHQMAGVLRDALAGRGTEGSEPDAVVAYLTAHLHNAAAWAAVLEPGDDPAGLAHALLPALSSGSLLIHPLTHENAGRLLSALSGKVRADLATALQEALAAAGDRASANGMSDRFLDELLGCLEPATVTSPGLAARLEELDAAGGAPPLTPRISIGGFEGRYTLLDRLAEDGVQLPEGVAVAVSALDEEMAILRNGKNDERREQERRLPELFLAADRAVSDAGLDCEQLHLLLASAASMLAGDDRALPGTPAGERVAALLLQAAESDSAGRFLG